MIFTSCMCCSSCLMRSLQQLVCWDDDGNICHEHCAVQHEVTASDGSLLVFTVHYAEIRERGQASAGCVAPVTAKKDQACHFSAKCKFSVVSMAFVGPYRNFHVRLASSCRCKLSIGTTLEVCDADDADALGRVTQCSPVDANSRTHVLMVEMSKLMVYLPCAAAETADGLLIEVLHVFPNSSDLTQEFIRRAAENEANRQFETAADNQRNFDQMRAKKEKALEQSQQTLCVTADELGMVQLRQGFLVAQPTISRIIKQLMRQPGWYPDTCDETCIRIFGSRDGPWDMFRMFNFLLTKPNKEGSKDIFGLTVAALCQDGSDEGSKDTMRGNLQTLIDNIFFVRNWWAHVGALSADCVNALQAIKAFTCVSHVVAPQIQVEAENLISQLDALINSVHQQQAIAEMSIDDVAYLFFLRANRRLCQFCTDSCATLPDIPLCQALRKELEKKGSKNMWRQNSILEAHEVSDAILSLKESDKQEHRFDLAYIRGTRNALSHASNEGNRVILVLVALGAIVRVVKFVASKLLNPSGLRPGASHAYIQKLDLLQQQALGLSEFFTDIQAELLARAQLFDIKQLISELRDSQKSAIETCAFSHLIQGDDFRIMQLMLFRSVCGISDTAPQLHGLSKLQQDDSGYVDVQEKEKSRLRSLIHLVAQIPSSRSTTLEKAVEWLLEPQGPGLMQSCGLSLVKEDFGKTGFISQSLNGTNAKQFWIKLCEALRNKEKTAAVFEGKKHEYYQACFINQSCRNFEDGFCKKHGIVTDRLYSFAESNQQWDDRATLLKELTACADSSEKLKKLCSLVQNVLHAAASVEADVKTFEVCMQSSAELLAVKQHIVT